MAATYKIHPSIGFARVGNSPDEFFVDTERLGEMPFPSGGFKDAHGRIKRQAARFRIFQHHDDGSFTQITNAQAEITWKVHLANKKATSHKLRNNGNTEDLIIDPGCRTLSGPGQRQLFDTGSIQFSKGDRAIVPLGEIRSDLENRLLVLGGFGNSGSPAGEKIYDPFVNANWYDDISDGPVTAEITLKADGIKHAVVGAWVIVTPPKFAPHITSVVTLYDRIFQVMVDAQMIPKPASTFYTTDIYPILQRTKDIQWAMRFIDSLPIWEEPVLDSKIKYQIFKYLRVSEGRRTISPWSLDSGEGYDRVTQTQFEHLRRWLDGNPDNFINDWAGVPAITSEVTPDELDRVSLERCIGAPMAPGIEVGGRVGERPILNPANYVEPFRLKETLSPGEMTCVMPLPWQSEFFSCSGNWWIASRPFSVIRDGVYRNWTEGVIKDIDDMLRNWSLLRFIEKKGNQQIETS